MVRALLVKNYQIELGLLKKVWHILVFLCI